MGMIKIPHRDVTEHNLAALGGRSSCGKGATMSLTRLYGFSIRRLMKRLALQTCRGGVEGIVEEGGFDIGIDGDDVQEIKRPTLKLRTCRGGSVGDAFHLLEVFGVELPQEKRIGHQPHVAPAVARGLVAAIDRQGLDEPVDLRRHEPAMLVSPLIGLSLDVQHDPACLRIAIACSKALHRDRVGMERLCAWSRLRPCCPGEDR